MVDLKGRNGLAIGIAGSIVVIGVLLLIILLPMSFSYLDYYEVISISFFSLLLELEER
jgi:hypothetical protein